MKQYIFFDKKSSVRSIDIAEHMSYSKPCVSRAVGILKNENYIKVDKDGYITLTDRGFALAEKIYERLTILRKVLMILGIDEETASENACRIEHVISEKSFETIKKYVEDK